MGRLARSWQTFKESLHVLKMDKELLLFPVFSGIASLIIVASFVAPTWFTGILERAFIDDPSDPNAQYTMLGLFAVMYFVLSFITVYFNSALVYAANERLAGGDPTIGSGLRGANQRLGKILAWSLFAATVSLLIHVLESLARGRNNIVGAFVAKLMGVAWALATYFAIPVILFENTSTFGSLRRSGSLFKQRWGESLVGEWGLGFVLTVVTMGGVFGLFALGMLFAANAPASVAPFILGFMILSIVLYVVFVSILGQALGAIYKVALYRYATKGEVAPQFTPVAIQDAYRAKT